MNAWAGIALAQRGPEDDAMHSRVPTYVHPLAGRSVAWHVLRAMGALNPAPRSLVLASPLLPEAESVADLDAELVPLNDESDWRDLVGGLPSDVERVVLVDGAAPALDHSLAVLVYGPVGRVLVDENGAPVALSLERDDPALAHAPDRLEAIARGRETIPGDPADTFLVRDRVGLARAARVLRDRIVRRHMEDGVTFLLPESVLVDVDVRIGKDTVVYPGVVLEGKTTIGAETVIGPGCRIIDSWVGSGVELKGWNYVVGTSIRNRAVLEPYVRRGFD